MLKNCLLYSLIILLLVACNPADSTLQKTPIAELTQGAVIAPAQTAIKTIQNTLPVTMTPSFPTSASPTSNPASGPSATPSFVIKQVIHEQPGDLYETLFSIPVGPHNIIQYKISSIEIEGPNAIAVLPDESFLIVDPVGDRLLRYDQTGHLLTAIELADLEIGYVRDLRVKGNEIFLLETSYQKFRVHRLAMDGSLIAGDEIPYQYPIDVMNNENTLEGGLTGIAIDCEGRIILEVSGGSRLLPLSDVQNQPDPKLITQSLLCNGKRYFVTRSGPWTDPQVSAGEILFQTRLTYSLGSLNFLDLFQDGSIYIVRDDVVTDPVITVDQTVHYIGADGGVIGVARIPLSEFYYPIMRKVAINSRGEAFVLLPRPDSLDIVRLNFYGRLPPLIEGAAKPEITIVADQ